MATHGVIVVDKPAGWTSHDVVAKVRKIFHQRRVGHAGTLDPDATGVLLVGLGRATRVLRFLQDTGKGYRGTIVFGVSTTMVPCGPTIAQTVQLAMEYDPQPPFDSGSPGKAPPAVREYLELLYQARDQTTRSTGLDWTDGDLHSRL